MEKVGKGEQQEKERGKDGDKGGEGMREGKKKSKSAETEVWKWCFASKLCKHSSNSVCCRVTSWVYGSLSARLP